MEVISLNLPKFDEFYPDILEILKNKEVYRLSVLRDKIARKRNINDEERRKLLDSGTQSVYDNRIGWALTYLKKAGIIERPERAKYKISNRGLEYIKEKGIDINTKSLNEFEEFREFQTINQENKNSNQLLNKEKEDQELDLNTPDEIMNHSFSKIQDQLSEDILTEIMNMSPLFFEKLVLDLLYEMGYGGKGEDRIIYTAASRDDGIDGLIKEDELGLEHIYVQAKRWKGTVGQPEIQKFSGALNGKGANKGVFITTSQFSKQAINFSETLLASKIVLIDGEKLTNLMITYGVGLFTKDTYKIQRIDTDYFNEEM